MASGAYKALRRQDITFEDKDQALRDDVRVLGTLVGDLIREQGGSDLFEFVETARLRSIRRREQNEREGEELAALVENLSPEQALQVIRSFSTYFQMVNTAEKVHRIRRRREYLRDVERYQPGGPEDTFMKLKASGMSLEDLLALIGSLSIEPVFTAHPTEPTRRTILRKEQQIVKHLVDMLNPTMTPQESNAALQNIRLLATTGWQTDEHPSEQMTVADELEHVLFFMTRTCCTARCRRSTRTSSMPSGAFTARKPRTRVFRRSCNFASWVGGDMDGNPNVNAKTIRSTLARQRALILDLYYKECAALSAKLSQAEDRVGFSDEMLKVIDTVSRRIPECLSRGAGTPPRHAVSRVPAPDPAATAIDVRRRSLPVRERRAVPHRHSADLRQPRCEQGPARRAVRRPPPAADASILSVFTSRRSTFARTRSCIDRLSANVSAKKTGWRCPRPRVRQKIVEAIVSKEGIPEHLSTTGPQDDWCLPGDRLLPPQVRQARHRSVHRQHDAGRRRHPVRFAARTLERAAQSQGRGAARYRAAAGDRRRPPCRAGDPRRPAIDPPLSRPPAHARRRPDRDDRLLGQQQGWRAGLRSLGTAERPGGARQRRAVDTTSSSPCFMAAAARSAAAAARPTSPCSAHRREPSTGTCA